MRKFYDTATKQEAIRLYFQEGWGSRRIANKLHLSDESLARYWVHRYIQYGSDALVSRRVFKAKSRVLPNRNREVRELEGVLSELKAENAFLRLAHNLSPELITVRGKYELIKQCANYPVSRLCSAACVSRSGYYNWARRQKEQTRKLPYNELLQRITKVYEQSQGTYGYRRIDIALRADGVVVNHKRLQQILRENHMQSRLYVPDKRGSTNCAHTIKPNLLQQDFYADAPNSKWVTDITCFHADNQKLYLMCIMDLFKGKIISYKVSTAINAKQATACMHDAIRLQGNPTNLILHSDQGAQYTSNAFCCCLKEHNIIQSMSRRGNCFDNARMESFFGHMKAEMPLIFPYGCIEALEQSIKQYIEYYNERRIKLPIAHSVTTALQ